ncbi:MAG: DMT family transporter [Actinobacteria bacterium]|nr:DMT family transporter [Actinomycetota bacterium]
MFLHFAYTGGIFVAIHEGVSAGITAVIVSLQPVLVSLLAIPLLGEHLRASQVAGLALGLTGVTLLLVPKILQGNTSLAFSTIGVLAAGFALVGSVWGTLEQKRYGSDLPILYGLAFQYTVSGVLLAILAVTTESLVIEWSMQFVAVLLWIVLGVSIGSVIMLFYLLRRGSAGSVSSLLYLGTPLAATFGYIFFDEHISSVGAIGMAIAVFGVWLVLRQEKVKA